MELTEEQKERFLEHVREGLNRQQAAEKVGATGTRFRFLCNRDPVFRRRYEEALVEGRGALSERLERCAVELALEGHWPALKFMLATYGEQFAWARTSRVEVGTTVEIQAVAGVLAKYLPPDMYEQLLQTVEQRLNEQSELPVLSS
jgi:hypothetical protein